MELGGKSRVPKQQTPTKTSVITTKKKREECSTLEDYRRYLEIVCPFVVFCESF